MEYDPKDIKLISNNFAGDMNADGRTDLVMLYDSQSENKTRFKIYLSKGTSFDTNPIQIETSYTDSEKNLRFLTDVDGDRFPEWVTINRETLNKMVVNRIDLNTKVVSTNEYAFNLGTTNYKNVSLADINADGKSDLVAVLESGSVSVCLFTGDGFTEAQVSDSLNPKPQFIKSDDSNTYAEKQNNKIFADINGDKKADIVALGLKEVVKKTPFLFTLDGFFVESMDINEYEPTASLAILFSDTSSNDLITIRFIESYTYPNLIL
ncbi:MAG: VCBS repeat-containing protein [Leptospiraceae bacterium]|nr:VCBS repeat-containing protein [Leptospiraceae bacterium]